jgi:RES domain-containing protein
VRCATISIIWRWADLPDRGIRWRGRAYRGHDPQWAFDPISGEGARIAGGRFNKRGQAALYLACDIATVIVEVTQSFANRLPPILICEYDVDCDAIADLTDDATRQKLGIEIADLSGPWLDYQRAGRLASSQAVAAFLKADGYAGITVRSFAHRATEANHNLVLWDWGPDLPHQVSVHDPDARLPRTQASWE